MSPIVATVIGDPCGVGPEVVLKALATGQPQKQSRPLLIGSLAALEKTRAACGIDVALRAVADSADARYEPGVIDVLDPVPLDPAQLVFGRASAACGEAVLHWLETAERLGRAGAVQASIMAPVDSTAIRLTGKLKDLDDLQPAGTWLLRVSGALRVVPIAEHVLMRDVPATVTQANVLALLRLLDDTLKRYGLAQPRIAVAGLNPHAMGPEDREQIAPAVEQARAEGIVASGPISPDAVFRQCIEGRHDAVVSMYHDQGQIAVKTAVFEGACSIYIGLPYVHLSIPHGSAYDIAGKGIAQHKSMLSAMLTAAALAAGRGFL
ncbi:MAG: 4-hydroxythreonine-4-phosphate dehydrogenase PdxA [Immundisolibacter sp.]|uniref:PdxA family dehydrogenase n=1 Tax=Immundisolibacter sp. TaxID=1934948 RepID=UPI0019C05BC2|nr:4-hydroxythreonine-4-phosphate dehydrogenase PdxA [Immundisolibacter sp.]MBC7161242.1 4-hydroxythreonine-4-phosphate dehydrogenase PdxA [Immundisolibacter sp.]